MDPLLCLPTAPPDPGVRLETGLEQPWPWGDPHGNDSGFTLLEGEVALIAALIGDQGSPLLRQCLGCFQAPCVLPLLTAPAAGLELHLRVVTTARLQPRPTGQEPTPTWLDPLALRADLEAEMRRQADRNAAFEPLDRQAERRQLAAPTPIRSGAWWRGSATATVVRSWPPARLPPRRKYGCARCSITSD